MPRTILVLIVLAVMSACSHGQSTKPLPPAEAKAAFRKLLDRPKVPLDVREEKPGTDGERLLETLSLATEKKRDGAVERMPVLLMRPKPPVGDAKPLPVMICLHGTGGSKEGMRPWLRDFADRGFVAVAIDARYHGERSGCAKGAEAYVDAITRAWRTPAGQPHEHPWFYDTCWDLWRLLDYLETRRDIDPKRIGMLGTSMGGIQTYLAGSVDDRVALAIPLIAVQSFQWSLDHDQWQGRAKTVSAAHAAVAKDIGETEVNAKVCRALWGKVLPGVTSDFDGPNMLPLFAGRPMLVANGELDPNCPIEGAKLAFDSARAAYERAKAQNKLVIIIEKGVAHKVTEEMYKASLEFACKWLKAE